MSDKLTIECIFETFAKYLDARDAGDNDRMAQAAAEGQKFYDTMDSGQIVGIAELENILMDAKNGLSFAAHAFRRLGDKGMAEAMEQRFPRIEGLIGKLKDHMAQEG